MMLDRISQHTFLPEFMSNGGIVLDLGFNQGEFSYPVISKYGCRILAVEPVSAFCESAQPHPDLEIMNAAVLGTARSVQMLSSADHGLSATILDHETVATVHSAGSSENLEVEGVTLGSLIDSVEQETIDLIKMDIEGAELEVLPSLDASNLQRVKQIAVEFHDFWYPELSARTEAVKAELQRHGFEMIRFTPNNKDVLFINTSLVRLGPIRKFWIAHVLRNINGFGRMLMIPLRKLGFAT